MKRFVVLLVVVGFLAALPLSHLAFARQHKVTICHITDQEETVDPVLGPGVIVTGHEITISENALDAHLAHGDLLVYRGGGRLCGAFIPDAPPR